MSSASVSVCTFEMLWIENGACASPTVYTSPSSVTTAMPKVSRGTEASAGM